VGSGELSGESESTKTLGPASGHMKGEILRYFFSPVTSTVSHLDRGKQDSQSSLPSDCIPSMKAAMRVGLLCGVLVVLSGCNRQTFTMQGEAMEPTIPKNEKVVFDKSSYKKYPLQRWDVVALHPLNATDKETTWALRIVGLPGEQISFSGEGDILIDGAAAQRPSAIASIRFVSGRDTKPVTVPPDSYYLLGDNTTKAYDSRSWGALPRANILGKVIGK